MSQYDDRVGVHNLTLTPKERAEKKKLEEAKKAAEKKKRDALYKKQQDSLKGPLREQ
jgi:hypothetical protein